MSSWEQRAKDKAASVLALIPAEWRIDSPPSTEQQRDVTGDYIRQYLSEREILITESDAVDIVQNTSNGKWTAVEVAKAFCHRAAIAHQLVNCLHEIFFDAAVADAERADQYLAQHRKPIGTLHGLPVSLKDQFHVKGVDTSMGYVGWIGTFEGKTGTGKEKVYESLMVEELRELGATLYCKTSVPQALMCGETINNIISYTYNPKNRNLSSGGSSGGEGALIGLRGSPIGVGTDIGGSIRIPAAFNGLYGIRPSSGRLPYQGMANSYDGQNSILSVVGPLAPTASALKLFVQAILSRQPWLQDPLTIEMPWRAEIEASTAQAARDRRLTFAVMRNDGTCTPHPPVARAVDIVVEKLERLGHKVIDWKPTIPHSQLGEITARVWSFDGGLDARKAYHLSGEPMFPQIMDGDGTQVNATEIMQVNVLKREAQKKYMDYWNSTAKLTDSGLPIDAIICPLAPFAAARPGKYTYYTYSGFVNTLDYTSVVVPVTQVDKHIDKAYSDFRPLGKEDADTQATYDPEIHDGAHVSLQLVGRRLQEEKMLAIAQYVGDVLKSA